MASSTDETSLLPMPTPTVPRKPLLSFKVVSFDIFGTLIDWETSIVQALQPLVSQLPPNSPHAHLKTDRLALAALYNAHEHALQAEHPTLPYDELLAQLYLRMAHEFGLSDHTELEREATRFGASVGAWLPFPDTVDACRRLAKHFKLVPLSNVDRASFTRVLAGPLAGVPFWRSYVAEEIGSYKPDLRNFEYLVAHVRADSEAEAKDDADVEAEGGKGTAGRGWGVVQKDEILHTAQSLFHDHVPAKKMGLSSVWIARKGAGMGGAAEELHRDGQVGYGWRFATLGEMADAVESEARERDGKR